VVSTYVGSNDLSRLCADADRLDQAHQEAVRNELRQERDHLTRIDQRVDSISDQISTLLRGTLLFTGYHTHKGEWRMSRHGRS
jgi:hypothetical protein